MKIYNTLICGQHFAEETKMFNFTKVFNQLRNITTEKMWKGIKRICFIYTNKTFYGAYGNSEILINLSHHMKSYQVLLIILHELGHHQNDHYNQFQRIQFLKEAELIKTKMEDEATQFAIKCVLC